MKSKDKSSLLAISFAVLILISIPFAFIWSLNTLFLLGISYNFKTWVSVVILFLFFDGYKLFKDEKNES